jgi:hypothetical protein
MLQQGLCVRDSRSGDQGDTAKRYSGFWHWTRQIDHSCDVGLRHAIWGPRLEFASKLYTDHRMLNLKAVGREAVLILKTIEPLPNQLWNVPTP